MKFLIIIFTYIISVSSDVSHLGYNYDRPQQTFEYHQQEPVLITPPPLPQNIYTPEIRQQSLPPPPPIQIPNYNLVNPLQAPPSSISNYLLPAPLPSISPPAPPTFNNFAEVPNTEQEIQSILPQEPIQSFYRQPTISVTEPPYPVHNPDSVQPIYRQQSISITQPLRSFNIVDQEQQFLHEQTLRVTEPPSSIQPFNIQEPEHIPEQIYGPAPGFRKETQAIPFPNHSVSNFVIPNNNLSPTFIGQKSENDYLPPYRSPLPLQQTIQTISQPTPIFFTSEPAPFSIPSSTPAPFIPVPSPEPELRYIAPSPRPIFQSNVVPLRPQHAGYNYDVPNVQFIKKK